MKKCFVIVASTFALACGTGQPKFLASDRARSIQASDGVVAWNAVDGKVRTIQTDGGNLQTLVSDALSAEQLALDNQNVYWVESTWTTQDPKSSVKRAPRSGGPPTTLATYTAGNGIVVLDNGWLYVTSGQAIYRFPVSGGPLSLVTSAVADQLLTFIVASQTVYWEERTFRGSEQWCSIYRAPVTGGGATQITADVPCDGGSVGIAAVGDSLFWLTSNGIRMFSSSGGPARDVAKDEHRPLAITSDARRVYWVTSTGAVRSATANGRDVKTHANQSGLNEAVAVDDANIYWSNGMSILYVEKH